MIDKHLPQSDLVNVKEPLTFLVTKALIASSEVVIDLSTASNTQLSLYSPGQNVEFLSNEDVYLGTGTVRALNFKTKKALALIPKGTISTINSLYKCKLSKWWKLGIAQSMVIASVCKQASEGNTAILSATCSYMEPHYQGLISWSLFYKLFNEEDASYVEVTKGHDYYSKGVCFVSAANYLWKPGNYKLVAERYSSNSRVLLKRDSTYWSPEVPVVRLGCGGYEDTLPSLYL